MVLLCLSASRVVGVSTRLVCCVSVRGDEDGGGGLDLGAKWGHGRALTKSRCLKSFSR